MIAWMFFKLTPGSFSMKSWMLELYLSAMVSSSSEGASVPV